MKRLAGLTPTESSDSLFGEDFQEITLDDDLEVEEEENQDRDEAVEDQASKGKGKHEPKPRKRRRKPKVTLIAPTRTDKSTIDGHQSGCSCPKCEDGKLYNDTPRKSRLFMAAQTVELVIVVREALRCRTCETTLVAPKPEVLLNSAAGLHAGMIARLADLKFRLGMPSLRSERWLEEQGVILSDSRQYESFSWAAEELAPMYTLICQLIANSILVYRDDTTGRVIDHQRKARLLKKEGDVHARVGIYTSYFEAELGDGKVLSLVDTSSSHNGEVFSELLTEREQDELLISMSDASAMNFSGVPAEKTKTALCLAHARRKFYDLRKSYKKTAVDFVQTINVLFFNDQEIAQITECPEERLRLHRQMSSPTVVKLSLMLASQLEESPPNSYLRDALNYLHKHWEGLTLFLNEPGVPLCNNTAERGIKNPIRHRKNSLFYRTLKSAQVGNVLSTLLLSAEKNGLSPPAYLTHLLTNRIELWKDPSRHLPWAVADELKRRDSSG